MDQPGEREGGQGHPWALFQSLLKAYRLYDEGRRAGGQFSRHVGLSPDRDPSIVITRRLVDRRAKYSSGTVGPLRTWEITHAALTHPRVHVRGTRECERASVENRSR
jgi:hypothetical protein